MELSSPVTKITGVGPQKAQELAEMEIVTIQDLIQHLPIRYIDASKTSTLDEIQDGEITTFHLELTHIETVRRRGGRPFIRVQATDGTDTVEILFFNQPYRAKSLRVGERWAVTGKTKRQGSRITLMNPTLEKLGANYTATFTGRVLPVYPQHGGITTRWLQKILGSLRPHVATWFPEYLPETLQKKHQILPRTEAWESIHFPESGLSAEEARKRIAFDELWEIFSGLENEEENRQKENSLLQISAEQAEEIWSVFSSTSPFPLTDSQTRAIQQILKELQNPWPLKQLVFGEVGSGKTLVAAAALLTTAKQGKQALYLAPTTVLAQQHFETISALSAQWGIETSLWAGSEKGNPNAPIIIGTHALFHGKDTFSPAMVIIDEEHRFGVRQREHSWLKNQVPHHITMTATPIPRTLAHLLYGQQSFSALEPIAGKERNVTTRVTHMNKLNDHWEWLEKEVASGQQAFIITPLIEPSETPGMEHLASATAVFAAAQKATHGVRLALLTGKTSAQEKNRLLQQMRDKEIDVLVSTPVIEVGVDIPDASIISILSAERFGFAQLHQLRGRVGRRGQKSWCFLLSSHPQGGERLKHLETLDNGAELAELDLQRRGAGEFFGVRQHGWDGLQVASWFDLELLQKVKSVRQEFRLLPKS